jgi:glycosyltransferase involved in cell wall biosynthesis
MSDAQVTVAYLMSRFPKLTETFVLYEMLELRKLGLHTVVLPLRLEKESAAHPEVQEAAEEIFPAPMLSLRTLGINLKWLLCRPLRVIGTLIRAAAGSAGDVKLFAGALLYFPKAVAFADTVQRLGVSHVHAHFATHPALAAWIIHRLCGVSYSFTAHGSDVHITQTMLPQKVRDAAFAVTVCEYNRRFIAEKCGGETAEKFEVIHCGVDGSLFLPREKEASSGSPLEILCIASYGKGKGHRVLIDACAKLKERGVLFRCRLVGYGPQEGAIKQQVRDLDLTGLVLVEGPQPRPEVIRMLGESDVVVLTSIQLPDGRREGIPVALMEGMACGLPVAASRLAGIPELVKNGESGVLFTPGDVVEAADALEQLANDPALRARMGAQARAQIEQAFDLTQNARLLAERIFKLREHRA